MRTAGGVGAAPTWVLFLGTAMSVMTLPAAAQEIEDSRDETVEDASDGGIVLDTIDVTAAPGTTTEDTGSWTTEWMRSATGLVLSQKETPQSTSVITDAQMKDRNITTIPEVMSAATGITVQAYESDRVNYYSRGFPIDAYQFDGVPLPQEGTFDFGDNDPDMVLYDHVEIVRGATGLMQGAGEPGASINYIRKRPTSLLRREVAAGFAYPLGARVETDVAGPLNQAGTVRGRVVGAIDSREGTLDGYSKDKYVGFGALEFDLTDQTVLNLGLSYQATRTDNVTWGGIPPFDSNGDLIDWPRGFNLGADWTYLDTDRTEAFAALEHIFDNGWTGRVTATHMRTETDMELAWISGIPDAETGLGMGTWAAKYDGEADMNSLFGVLNGDFGAFGRQHQFVLGVTGSRTKGTYRGYPVDTATLATLGNIFEYRQDMPRPSFGSEATYTYSAEATQVGVYGTTQIHATDQLALIAGARVSWWDGKQTQNGDTFAYDYTGIVTPYVGFTYDITDVYTAYGSITSIYKPQLVQDAAGNYFDPAMGWNYELGVKAGFFDGALYASAAIFQTDQKDVANYLYFDEQLNRSVYELIDGTKTQGFELELAGAISENWNASLGYTYRYSRDDDGNELYTDQPRNTLKLATDYRIPGVLQDRLTVGGAMRWQSATDSLVFQSEFEQPSIRQKPYAVFDVNAQYDLTEQTVLSLSVTNVFDKKYYATTGFYDTVVYGDGIAAELMLRARF
ncbi:MAG: TonB-dependent siderophore receptor [Amaricoccus sp.]|uniref:TonB-dependent siderophore receptor n=1 Tax=Amaricoccus sp. TaxID=1872485 RepID=UPI0039E4F2D9